MTSGIIFFEFTTLIILLAAAGSSIVKRVRNTQQRLVIFIECNYDLQPPSAGDINSIKFNFVVMSAVCSMFISSKMGTEISFKVRLLLTIHFSFNNEVIIGIVWISFQKYLKTFILVVGRIGPLNYEHSILFC